MSTREKIKEGLALYVWLMQWSDHVEDHRCYRLPAGCRIEDHAPPVPAAVLERAEDALQRIEARLAAHAPLQAAIDAAHAAISLPVDVEDSPVCRALYAAAYLDLTDKSSSTRAAHNTARDSHDYEAIEAPIELCEDPAYAERFGGCLGYAILGVGISWSDDHADLPMPGLYYCSDIGDKASEAADAWCAERRQDGAA